MCVKIVRGRVRLKVDSHGMIVKVVVVVRRSRGKVAHVAAAGGFDVFHQLLVVFIKGVGGQGQAELAIAQVLKLVLVGVLGVSGNTELGAGLSAGIAVHNDTAAKAEDRHKITSSSTNRGIRTNVLSHTGRLAGRVVEQVAEDAGRLGVFGVLAGSAGELQLVGVFVFLGVQHVGALGAEAKGDLLELLGAGGLEGGGGLRSSHLCVSCEEEDDEVEKVEEGEGTRCASLVAIKCWSMRSSLAVVEQEEMRKWNKISRD